jgi:hypothetical protein
VADDPDDARRADDGGPDRGVDAFDAIVSSWRADGPVPQWPDDPADPHDPRPPPRDPAPPAPAAHRPPTGPAEPVDEHFVPPEPPPLPRLGPPAAVGLGLLVLGLVLVTAPGWLGVGPTYGLPLGLVTLAAGLGWLVLRLWPTPPDDGDDDGARL